MSTDPAKPSPPGEAAAPGLLPSLDELRASVPPECFEVSTPLSLLYVLAACGALATAPLAYPLLAGSAAGLALYAAVYGTVMWTMFVLGHDAGHGHMSRDSPLLNDVVGHLVHAPLLVPFYPWALSHRHHHMNHSHVTKDLGNFLLTPERRKTIRAGRLGALREGFADSNALMLLATPIQFPMFIFAGVPHGSHVLPWGNLWRRARASRADIARGVVSTLSVAACAAAIFRLEMGWAYWAPWLVHNSWLIAVTYMQHHTDETRFYGDASWGFVRGAFETVDRVLGMGLDEMSLHSTSDHLAHHLFFGSVPHYRLRAATEGLRAALARRGARALHQRVEYASPLHFFAHYAQTTLRSGFSSAVVIES
jgi:acyl-lipid omega-3 desaturase